MPFTFSAEQKKAVNQALKLADDLKREVAKAKQANIPIGDLETKLQEAETRLRSIKQVYFPGG